MHLIFQKAARKVDVSRAFDLVLAAQQLHPVHRETGADLGVGPRLSPQPGKAKRLSYGHGLGRREAYDWPISHHSTGGRQGHDRGTTGGQGSEKPWFDPVHCASAFTVAAKQPDAWPRVKSETAALSLHFLTSPRAYAPASDDHISK